MKYIVYRTDRLGRRKWQTFTDFETAEYNRANWQKKSDYKMRNEKIKATYTLETED